MTIVVIKTTIGYWLSLLSVKKTGILVIIILVLYITNIMIMMIMKTKYYNLM